MAAAVTAFTGWLLVALVGYAHKVVPFIVWSALRGRGIKQKADGTPLMFADLYDHRWAGIVYGLVTAGIAAVCIGFATSTSIAIAIGGVLLAVTGLCVAVNLSLRPIRLLRAPRADRVAPAERWISALIDDGSGFDALDSSAEPPVGLTPALMPARAGQRVGSLPGADLWRSVGPRSGRRGPRRGPRRGRGAVDRPSRGKWQQHP